MGIETLTDIQTRCLEEGMGGRDLLCKSNTGSGKTLAFMLVAVERLVHDPSPPDPTKSFPVVVLSPVTDLATQIATVSRQLLKYTDMKTDAVIGGTSEQHDLKRLTRERIDVLVATPGRFKSLLRDGTVRERLKRCRTFVIDEADKLLSPGFLRDVRDIHTAASNPQMQTLMFSATLDKEVIKTGLLSDPVFIEVLSADKSAVNTRVTQNVIVCDVTDTLDAVVAVVSEQRRVHVQRGGGKPVAAFDLSDATRRALAEWPLPAGKGFRIMCFLSSNAFIDYFAKAFEVVMPEVETFVLHGNLPQNKRSRTSEAFRGASDCILFTSDASARGVDYPDITCVIQIGFDSRTEYLQRIGRTGRAGKAGETFLVICPMEAMATAEICQFVNHVYATGPTRVCDKRDDFSTTGIAFPSLPREAKHAYRGWLGSLASRWKRLKMSKSDVIKMAQDMSTALGLGVQDEEKLKSKLHL